jgi:hypothetical protein
MYSQIFYLTLRYVILLYTKQECDNNDYNDYERKNYLQ